MCEGLNKRILSDPVFIYWKLQATVCCEESYLIFSLHCVHVIAWYRISEKNITCTNDDPDFDACMGRCRFRGESGFAPGHWETVLLCNGVSHWLGASLDSALRLHSISYHFATSRWRWLESCVPHIHNITAADGLAINCNALVHSEYPGPISCLLHGVSSGCVRAITGQVTSVTWPVIGWA